MVHTCPSLRQAISVSNSAILFLSLRINDLSSNSSFLLKTEKSKPYYSKTCIKRPLSKRPKIAFQDQLSLNAGQKYCRMLQGEHSAILLTFIKLPFVIKIFLWSIFEWSFYTGFTVVAYFRRILMSCKRKLDRFFLRSSIS